MEQAEEKHTDLAIFLYFLYFLKLERTTAFRKGKKKEEKKKEEALNKRLLNSSSAIFVTICSIIFYATNSFSRPGMSFLLENGFSLLRESQDP